MPPTKRKPVVKAHSSAGPTSFDRTLDGSLEEYMSVEMPLETDAEQQRREKVLAALRDMFTEWVAEVCLSKGLPADHARDAGGMIFTSGSYRLGVGEPGSDIDTICVAPQLCTREDFFLTLQVKLRAHPLIEVRAVDAPNTLSQKPSSPSSPSRTSAPSRRPRSRS